MQSAHFDAQARRSRTATAKWRLARGDKQIGVNARHGDWVMRMRQSPVTCPNHHASRAFEMAEEQIWGADSVPGVQRYPTAKSACFRASQFHDF